ncbi:hypothetical protein [Sulfobacillus harzensis]|uniref:Uncharacterized protein n=1 Tax=Sulfobacillus harzensis TaxID=2729629 RepID=A0A7Y0Q3H8_9FIRM|nr:hypothetical protein [Sulfobacillus harzensis]NMP23405.1 hypothetical protein [Sulfobacillus harzensis]
MIRERIDARIEKRLEAVIEPHIETWLHRFFRSDRGQSLIAEVTADFLVSWMKPGEGKSGGYFQRTLVDLVQQMAETDPDFRNAVIDALNPHFKS